MLRLIIALGFWSSHALAGMALASMVAALACGLATPTATTATTTSRYEAVARAELQLLVDQLRLELSAELQRPGLVCAEQYYSVSGAGASLPLHMDERHEEAKGARGWAGTYRRSLSWLVYLSDPQHGRSAAWPLPQLGSCASSRHAWWTWAARYSQGEAGRHSGRPATCLERSS